MLNKEISTMSKPILVSQNFDDQDWFVVRTNSRCEKKVYNQLVRLGFTCFLPLKTTIRLWSDRKKKVTFPLIPSVVFVQGMKMDKTFLYTLNGIHSILKSNGKVGRVKNIEIEQLKFIGINDLDFYEDIEQSFLEGDNVEIINGPLKGLFANAIQESNSFRVMIEITNLGWGYCVSLPKNCVRKI
jgi:transcriptional antiterminator RfaH